MARDVRLGWRRGRKVEERTCPKTLERRRGRVEASRAKRGARNRDPHLRRCCRGTRKGRSRRGQGRGKSWKRWSPFVSSFSLVLKAYSPCLGLRRPSDTPSTTDTDMLTLTEEVDDTTSTRSPRGSSELLTSSSRPRLGFFRSCLGSGSWCVRLEVPRLVSDPRS